MIPRYWFHIIHDFCKYHIHSHNHIFCSVFLKTPITYEIYLLKNRNRCHISWALVTYTHYNDAKISVVASQITSLTIIYTTVYSGTDQRKHQSSASLAFARGIHRWPVNSPHKGQWRGALMFSSICAWINGWVNNREAGDLRRHRGHNDVTVMFYFSLWFMVISDTFRSSYDTLHIDL